MSPEAEVTALALDAATLRVDPAAVRRLARCGPSARWNDAIEAAIAEGTELARPRAWIREVDAAQLPPLFGVPTPVERIATDGARKALFVATLGDALERRSSQLLDETRFLEGVLLDAVGSTLVEALCDSLEARVANGQDSTRFSPGYCAWALSSQRAIFDAFAAAGVGVTLKTSFLMEPLKSVSGLVVTGNADDLHVPVEQCAACDAIGCTRRRAPRTVR